MKPKAHIPGTLFMPRLNLTALLVALLPFLAVEAAERDTLDIRVSESAQAIMKLAQPAFIEASGHALVVSKVEPTAKVIEDLARNLAPTGFITRDIKALDLEQASDLVGTPVGLDAIVMVVPDSNPITNLSVEQVRSIWTGAVVNWRDLGGPDLPITVIGRPRAYDIIQLFCDFMRLEARLLEGGLNYREKGSGPWSATVAAAPATDELALEMMLQIPGAISYFPAEVLNRYGKRQVALHGLQMNGTAPTPQAVLEGRYFIHRTVNIVTRGRPQGTARAFIDFLHSDEGQKLISRSGFLPYKP